MLIEEGIIKKEIGRRRDRRRTARIRGIITTKKQRNNNRVRIESTDNERRAIETGEKKSVFDIGGLVRVLYTEKDAKDT